MLKNAAHQPEWIGTDFVNDIYSVSDCIAHNFADYIKFWKHNGYWFFDSPEIIEDLVSAENIDASTSIMFYYEVHPTEYDEQVKRWQPFAADDSFPTNVVAPNNSVLMGFDVATFSTHTSPECSPLSCCALAKEVRVNEHCLFNTFDEALAALEQGKFANSEPGPFRVLAVHKVDRSVHGEPSLKG